MYSISLTKYLFLINSIIGQVMAHLLLLTWVQRSQELLSSVSIGTLEVVSLFVGVAKGIVSCVKFDTKDAYHDILSRKLVDASTNSYFCKLLCRCLIMSLGSFKIIIISTFCQRLPSKKHFNVLVLKFGKLPLAQNLILKALFLQ